MSKFGLEVRHLELLDQLVFAPLKAKGYRVWVFGSRARGDFQKFSDLDLLIEGKPDPIFLSKMRETLEESMLPIKVDLVMAEDLAESYKKTVIRDRIQV